MIHCKLTIHMLHCITMHMVHCILTKCQTSVGKVFSYIQLVLYRFCWFTNGVSFRVIFTAISDICFLWLCLASWGPSCVWMEVQIQRWDGNQLSNKKTNLKKMPSWTHSFSCRHLSHVESLSCMHWLSQMGSTRWHNHYVWST